MASQKKRSNGAYLVRDAPADVLRSQPLGRKSRRPPSKPAPPSGSAKPPPLPTKTHSSVVPRGSSVAPPTDSPFVAQLPPPPKAPELPELPPTPSQIPPLPTFAELPTLDEPIDPGMWAQTQPSVSPFGEPAISEVVPSRQSPTHYSSAPPDESQQRRRSRARASVSVEQVGSIQVDAVSSPAPEAEKEPELDPIDQLLEELFKTPPEMAELVPGMARPHNPEELLARACQVFPGPLWFDRHRPYRKLPKGNLVSALGAMMASLGSTSVPYLAWLLGSDDADARFYAALICQETPHPRLLRPLWQVALGADVETRRAAVLALREHRSLPDYAEVLRSLRHLATTVTTRQAWRIRALEALSQLGDAGAAADMIEVLGDRNRTIARAAHGSLVTLTAHDLGTMRMTWRRWLKSNGRRHRVEWLIDALEDRREELRIAAWHELERLSGRRYGLSDKSSREDFMRAREQYTQWWQQHRPERA